jgi:hypothetical protein
VKLPLNDRGASDIPSVMSSNGARITNLECANRQLALAVRLFFNDGDPVSVHTLTCAAREIYEKHCARAGIPRFFDLIKMGNPSFSDRVLWNVLNEARNFFKHPADSLDDSIEFADEINDSMLLAASFDSEVLCGEGRLLVEADAFLLWFKATSTQFLVDGALPDETEADRYLRDLDARYPGLRASPRSEKKRFGRALFSDGCPVIAGPAING